MIHNFRPWAAELVHVVRTRADRSTGILHRATCYRQRKCKHGPGQDPCSLHRCGSSISLSCIQQLAFGYQGGNELNSRSALPVSIDTKSGTDKPRCFPCMWWWCLRPVVVPPCSRGRLVSSCLLCSCSLWKRCCHWRLGHRPECACRSESSLHLKLSLPLMFKEKPKLWALMHHNM